MVSVVVPAYNSQKSIKDLIDSLLCQNFKGEYEIIVVDDGSIDSTAAIVSEYKKVTLLRQGNAGPAVARNKGAVIAKGDIVLFIDSDCQAFPDWISQMIKPFEENPEVAGVKGAYKTKQKALIARFVQVEYEDKYDKMKRNKYIDFVDTYSAGFRKNVFLNRGGYDITFPVACAEDVELSYRLSNEGYKMVFNPEALVYHLHPDTLSGYLMKKYKFAYWRVKAVAKNPNKAVGDSHTPVIMKLQVVLFLFTILSLPFIFLFPALPIFSLGIYFIASVPFTVKAIKKDIVVGVLSPCFLFLRSAAQFFGVAGGVINQRLR